MNFQKIIILIISFGLLTSISSQTADDYQKKIDSLELIKAELTIQIKNIDKEIEVLKPLKNEAWSNEQVGQVYVFKKDGYLYDPDKTHIQTGSVKKGTRIIYVKDKGTIGMIALVNGTLSYVVKHVVESLGELEIRERDKRIKDSIDLVNASPYIFNRDASMYKILGEWNTERKVSKGTEVLFVKNIQDGRTSEIIYQDLIFYTLASNIVSQEEYRKILNSENKNKERREREKQALIDKYGNYNGNRIFENKIWIGMTKAMLIDSWGKPNDINRTVTATSVNEQWVYGSQYVYLDDGVVTAWQD